MTDQALHSAQQPGPGRPRTFDPEAALGLALDLFWRRGFEATSLEELTAAMRLSRSSFYACFGSKRNVLLATMRSYAADSLDQLARIETEHARPADAVRGMICAIADPDGGPRGCLLVNCITELAPHDPELSAFARAHIERIEAIIARLLAKNGAPDAADRARSDRGGDRRDHHAKNRTAESPDRRGARPRRAAAHSPRFASWMTIYRFT